MTESYYQTKLVKYFEGRGWFVLNLIKTNKGGIPDLQLTHPARPTVWIEVKKDGGVLSEIQKYRIEQLQSRGEIAFVAAPKTHKETIEKVKRIEGGNA